MLSFVSESSDQPAHVEPTAFNPSSAEVLAALVGGERSPEMTLFLERLGQQQRDVQAWRQQQRQDEPACPGS